MSQAEIKAVLTVEGLKKFQSDMNAAGGAVEGAGDRSKKAGAVVSRAAKVGFVAAGAAAVASVKKFASFDDAMNRVQINSGASQKQMDKLAKVARKMGEDFPASGTEVAEAMNEILKAGMSVEDMLAGGLEQALSVATAEQMNMAESAKVMSNAMAAYEIDGKNSAKVTAALSNIASATTADVNDLAISLGYVGSSAHGLGIEIGDTSAALGVLIQNGLDGSKAGTALNAMLTSLSDPASKSSKALKDLGVNTYDAQGNFRDFGDIVNDINRVTDNMNMKEKAELFQTFGRVGANAARMLSGNTALFRDLSNEADKLDAPVQKARDQMKSLAMQLDTTQESIGNMGIRFGQALTPAVSAVLPVIQNATDAISSMPDGALQSAAAFVALTGAIWAAAPAIAATVTAFRAMTGAIAVQAALSGAAGGMSLFAGSLGAASIGVRTLTAAMLANPLFMAAGIAATVIATVAALKAIPGSGADVALQNQKAAADNLKSSLDGLKTSIDGVVNAQLTLAGSQLAVKRAASTYADAVARTKKAEEEHGKGSKEYKDALLGQQEAWHAKRVAIDRASKSSEEVAEKQKTLGKEAASVAKSVTDSAKNWQEAKSALSEYKNVNAAVVDGQRMTVGELMSTDDGLSILATSTATADSKIGKLAQVMLEASGAMSDARAKSSSVEESLRQLGGKAGDARGKIDAMRSVLDNLPSEKVVNLRVTTQKVNDPRRQYGTHFPTPMATGGRVFGAGTGTSDSVPAMLSAGEWVLTAKQARAIGYANLAAIPKFAKGGAWFTNQAAGARATMDRGSAYWKNMQHAGQTASPVDDRRIMQNQISVLQKRLSTVSSTAAAGKGDTLKSNREAKKSAVNDIKSMITDLKASVWEINKIDIPANKAAAITERREKQAAAATQAREAAVSAIGGTGSALWQQQQLASSTASLDDDLAVLQQRHAQLMQLGSVEALEAAAQTEAEIWKLVHVDIPKQQAEAAHAASQAVVNSVGARGTDLWKQSQLASATESLDDDLAALVAMRDTFVWQINFEGRDAWQRLYDTEAEIWTMLNVTMPAAAKQAAAAAVAARVNKVGHKGGAIWKQSQKAATTDTLNDDLAVLRYQLAELKKIGGTAAAERIADTEADIWKIINIDIPAQQAANAQKATQDAINAIGQSGSELWKREQRANVTDTLDDDLAVLRERLAALKKHGSAAADQIRDTEAEIWKMINITMAERDRVSQEQSNQWAADRAAALGQSLFASSGGGGSAASMGTTDTTGGDASGVGYAPRPEIDRVWLDGEQLNDLTARTAGKGVEIVSIIGWDEAEDRSTSRIENLNGDTFTNDRDGGTVIRIIGRVVGDTYQDYHSRRREVKRKIRAAKNTVLLKVSDILHGTSASDYPSTYSSEMTGMERREVRLVGNVQWTDMYGVFGSMFEAEFRSPSMHVEKDVPKYAPTTGTNNGCAIPTGGSTYSVLAWRGEVAAAPCLDFSTHQCDGDDQESVLTLAANNTETPNVTPSDADIIARIKVRPPTLHVSLDDTPYYSIPLYRANNIFGLTTSLKTFSDTFDIDTDKRVATPIARSFLGRHASQAGFIRAHLACESDGIIPFNQPTWLTQTISSGRGGITAVRSHANAINGAANGEALFVNRLVSSGTPQGLTDIGVFRIGRGGSLEPRERLSFTRTPVRSTESRPELIFNLTNPLTDSDIDTALQGYGEIGYNNFINLLTIGKQYDTATHGGNRHRVFQIGFYRASGQTHLAIMNRQVWVAQAESNTYAHYIDIGTLSTDNTIILSAFIDAGNYTYAAIVIFDAATGTPSRTLICPLSSANTGIAVNTQWIRYGTSGYAFEQAGTFVPTPESDLIGSYYGIGESTFASTCADTAVRGHSGIIAMDAASELALPASMMSSPSSYEELMRVGYALATWCQDWPHRHTIKREPIPIEVEWADTSPTKLTKNVIRLDSVQNSDFDQLARSKSLTGGLSTLNQSQMAYANAQGDSPIRYNEVR